MPRTVSANVETEITASPNRSCWLVTVEWTDIIHMTSWPVALTYSGDDYQPFDLSVQGPTMASNGEMRASLNIGNVDDVIGWYVLNYGLMDIEATIYQAYVDTDNAVVTDPELVFSGRTNGGSINKSNVTINLEENQSVRLSVLPRRFMTADNGFNHLPYRSQRIYFGDEVYELKAY